MAGQGATLGIWTPDLLKTLAQGRQVIIFDNRRIGFSTDFDDADRLSTDDYADSTVDLIDALGLDQPDILGWSLGGFIALTIAVNYGKNVHNVVVADTASGGVLGTLLLNLHVCPPLVAAMQLHARYPVNMHANASPACNCRNGASQWCTEMLVHVTK